jgi:hypothetical protein
MSKKIAAIVTAFFPAALGSHGDLIVSKFANGFPADDGFHEPQVDLVSMYIDQPNWTDLGHKLARDHNIEIYGSIRAALTLTHQGKPGHWTPENDVRAGELEVDGVLIVAEHGDYAGNEKGQHLYPRRYFFEQVCAVFASSGRSVPVFNDKHLSYDWVNAKWMYDRARELNVPFMAGSSLPLVVRNPYIEHEIDAPIEEALSVGYIHPFLFGLDSYGFHALESLQCMTERRNGGETGVSAVHCLEGNAVWEAGEKGLWSRELAAAADARIALKKPGRMEDNCENPILFLLEYVDGFKAATLLLPGHLQAFGYAARVNGRIESTELNPGDDLRQPFTYLGLNVQEMFLTGRPQYPVERTLLVSGVLDALHESRHRGHTRIETPHLKVSYTPFEAGPIRPDSPQ